MIYSDLKKTKVILDIEVDYFEGVIRRDKKEGFCRLIYNTGVIVEGFFEKNIITTGSIVFNNGIEYRGSF